ncbi:MAG: F0F1 ATP synthase subunit epsilon [Candidatus Bostrichicola ureolyticus]|nr:MAG: F0F1 ATP synthase subunit epsilon [Candidatus Bostrichicola ureolyticus]
MIVYIITTEKIVYNGDTYCVIVPGIMGYFQIFNNHDSILSILDSGIIKIIKKKNILLFKINGGIVEVNNNIINIMVCDIEKL